MKLIGVGMFIVSFVLMLGTVSWFNWWKMDGSLRYSVAAMQVLAVVLIAAGMIAGRSRVDVTEDEPAN